jgi:hypothetical protein
MKILPGRVRRAGKGRDILYFKIYRGQMTACDEPIGREPVGRELRVERLGAEWLNRVAVSGRNNVKAEHPRPL